MMKRFGTLLCAAMFATACTQSQQNEAAEETREATEATQEAGREVAGEAREAGAAVGEAGRDAANATTDAGVTAAVKTRLLADTSVAGLAINVDTAGGVVTLSGNVKTATESERAAAIARDTAGVTRVVNNLRVG